MRFVLNRLRSDADGIKGRVALLVGAIDKIGFLPLFLSIPYTYRTAKQAWSETLPPAVDRLFLALAVGYVFIVFSSLHFIAEANRLNFISGVVDLALLIKGKGSDTTASVKLPE